MAEKRNYRSPQDLFEHLKSMANAHMSVRAAEASTEQQSLQSAQRARQIAHCEDFFAKMETLLPTHDASRFQADHFLARLRAGKPDLPAEVY
jgi:hypothetical protein